ncbi:hypothetical protein NS184_02085 [Curtobacterium luteum]|uniref:DUF4232 domain-containing protein n=1 Tax=Curtobacterium luteum TaxID=33881 RepID=A0A175S319_9MICO|nr:hypothetical protein NS184_02085 [Curtobacterium luteum]
MTAAPSTASSSASPSSSPSTTGSASSDGGSSGSSSSVAACGTSSLAVGAEAGSGGAAGSTIFHITLENTGSASCTLQGWPGVSFVGGGDGQQIGAAASLDRSSPHPTVTLRPGQLAVAPVKVVRAENIPTSECSPVTPDGFRVYPPGSKTSLFLKDEGYTACRSSDAALLSVQALVLEGQATD